MLRLLVESGSKGSDSLVLGCPHLYRRNEIPHPSFSRSSSLPIRDVWKRVYVKLFHDYLSRSADEHGNPVVDTIGVLRSRPLVSLD
ncbi:hypothetical protein AN958_01738 [Leucoagaricus sp. SymC.cos]|nr:hypothetical protein AN958_01738 [Leucoagaricus sp. SymC.cos]